MKKALLLSLLLPFLSFAKESRSPFAYDLKITTIPGSSARTLVCFHGYGDSYNLVFFLKDLNCIDTTLVGFNFPEYNIKEGRTYDPTKASFGTIQELLPAIYVIKQVVLDQGLDSLDLYGFSAGGGALINVLKVLNT